MSEHPRIYPHVHSDPKKKSTKVIVDSPAHKTKLPFANERAAHAYAKKQGATHYHDGTDSSAPVKKLKESVEMKTFKQLNEMLNETATRDHRLNVQHADRIRKAADKQHASDKKTWAGERDMVSMVNKQHKDLHKVAGHVEAGDHKKAYSHMSKMDTSAKETIPTSSYNHIIKHGHH